MADAARAGRLTLDEAVAILQVQGRRCAVREVERVSTLDALHRVLAADLRSPIDVPPADNTSMDGYALRAADVDAPGTLLPVSQRIAAGAVPAPLATGTAARIFTGAGIPDGADCVVMQEQCEAVGDTVRVNVQPVPGQWIRRRGEDVQRGSVVLARGALMSPQALGLAAGIGAAHIDVLRRVRVALMSTGDELAMPGSVAPEDLPVGVIYNSNRFMLHGLLRAAGCDVTDLGIVPDRLDATCDAFARAAFEHDLILTSGGVSVGEEDHVRPALQQVGQVSMWQLAIKPGKPLAFGGVRRSGRPDTAATPQDQALFLGLPGNPVSSFVTFLLAAMPLIRSMQGHDDSRPWAMPMRTAFDWPRPDRERREFVRVRRNADGALELFGNQSSGVLTSAVWGDGLADLAAGQTVARGDVVPYLPWSSWGCV